MSKGPPDLVQLLKLNGQLKDEIIKVDQRNSQILALAVTASGAILTLGFNQIDQQRPWIFLCVYIFLIPTYNILKGNRRHIWRISTYQRVFVEPHLSGVKWETRLEKLPKFAGESYYKNLSSGSSTNEFRLISGVSFIVLIALLVNLVQVLISPEPDYDLFNPIITFIIGVATFIYFYLTGRRSAKQLQRNGLIENFFYENWRMVRKKEDEENENEKVVE
jgi:uncharacterized membrane protein